MTDAKNSYLSRTITSLLVIFGILAIVIGILGIPFGTGFQFDGGNLLLVGGGFIFLVLGVLRQARIWKMEAAGEWQPPAEPKSMQIITLVVVVLVGFPITWLSFLNRIQTEDTFLRLVVWSKALLFVFLVICCVVGFLRERLSSSQADVSEPESPDATPPEDE
jgi:hypothetical protein